MVSIKECIPTPIDSCPMTIQSILGDVRAMFAGSSFSLDPKAEAFQNEISFLIRRLWTYGMAHNKPIAMLVSSQKEGLACIMLVKVIDGKEENIISPVPYISEEFVRLFFQALVDREGAVFCSTLNDITIK